MRTATASYKGHRYPVEIINYCVWLYFRFSLSFRGVEELMLARGVVVFGLGGACRLIELSDEITQADMNSQDISDVLRQRRRFHTLRLGRQAAAGRRRRRRTWLIAVSPSLVIWNVSSTRTACGR